MVYLLELGRGIHYYFLFTLNDYERENFEPYVPVLLFHILIHIISYLSLD